LFSIRHFETIEVEESTYNLKEGIAGLFKLSQTEGCDKSGLSTLILLYYLLVYNQNPQSQAVLDQAKGIIEGALRHYPRSTVFNWIRSYMAYL